MCKTVSQGSITVAKAKRESCSSTKEIVQRFFFLNFCLFRNPLKTYLNSNAIKPVAIDTKIETVDSNEPIRRRNHSRHYRHLSREITAQITTIKKYINSSSSCQKESVFLSPKLDTF